MNAPVPALDERNEFVVAKLRTGGSAYAFTLDDGKGDCFPVFTSMGAFRPEDILNLPELRATVDQARRKREGKWPDYGLQITPLDAIPSPPARPTFAEALEREANLLYEAGVAIHGSERPETNVYRALIKAVERARRASEVP